MRVAGRPRVVAKGAVRPTCDFVEQRQVTRIGGLVDDDGVDRSGTSLRLFRCVTCVTMPKSVSGVGRSTREDGL